MKLCIRRRTGLLSCSLLYAYILSKKVAWGQLIVFNKVQNYYLIVVKIIVMYEYLHCEQ